MSSPPTASSPIPAGGRPTRKRSRMMQSSLDLVFSYSRSQQILYGQNLRSTPSFLDITSTSISSLSDYGSVRVGSAVDLEEGLGDEEEGYDGDSDSPADAMVGDISINSNQGEEVESRSSGSASQGLIFRSDPISSPNSSQLNVPGYSGSFLAPKTPPEGWISGRARSNYRIASSSTTGSGSTSRTAKPGDSPLVSMGVGLEDISPTQTPGIATENTPLMPHKGDPDRLSQLSPARTRRSSSRRLSERRSGSGFSKRQSGTRLRRSSMVRGESTDGQTLFNAVAVLLGIGLLSIPLAFAYAGWVGGTAILLGFAWLTCHTAKLLARLISADSGLMGYTDIGRLAFGRWGSLVINLLFCLELFALGVALIVLFGDTLQAIFPNLSSDKYKMLGFCLVLPTTLLPLRLLSVPSLLSTISTILLVLIILIDGFYRNEAPGSILHPANTDLWPETLNANWLGGIGLVLAGFGGHAVVPSLARDMKFPDHFDRVINRAFTIAGGVSFIAGAAGYLMIGNSVSDEITLDLLQPKYGYPRVLNLIALWMIVVIPLTKFGLCSRPLNVTLETILGIAPQIRTIAGRASLSQITTSSNPLQSSASEDSSSPISPHRRRSTKYDYPSSVSLRRPSIPPIPGKLYIATVISRTTVTVLITLTAIYIPGFGRVMAFLGSFSSFLICVILPLAFWLRLSPRLVPEYTTRGQKVGHWVLMLISVGLMIAGTVWTFLPDSGHGGLEE